MPGSMISKPPAKALSASSQFSFDDGFLMKKLYPAGIYNRLHYNGGFGIKMPWDKPNMPITILK
jgi:hypothetical protein